MDNPTPFHENHERPAGYNTLPPPPPKTKVPVWAWGLGTLLLGLIIALVVIFSTGDDKKEPEAAPAPAVTVTATATPEPTKEPTKEPTPEAKQEPTWSVTAPKELTEQDRTPAVMNEGQILAFLRETFPVLVDVPDEEIMHYSDQSCDLFEEGKTPEDVLLKMTNKITNATDAEAMGGIVGASVSNYCPTYSDDVAAYLEEMGVQPAPQGA